MDSSGSFLALQTWDQATVMPQRDSAIVECPKMSGGSMSNWSSCEATILF